ncbi:MAG: secreted protein [Candidatus Peribacteria bacterium]|nr:secreted protein [Candidatus Peribacteria bacterium]
MKRNLLTRTGSAIAVASLCATLIPMSALASFSDVSTSTPYKTAIEALQAKGILEGYADKSFKPGSTINRAEFVQIIMRATNNLGERKDSANCAPDIKNEWFANAVCRAYAQGFVSGYPSDGTFHPSQNISFVEATKILSLAYKQKKVQENYGDWYTPFTSAFESSKAIPPTINKLDKPITRGEMAEMMWRISEKKTDQPAIGVLNIMNPNAKVNFASDKVQVATSCEDIKAFSQSAGPSFMSNRGGIMNEAMPMIDAMGAAQKSVTAPAAAGTSNTDYSKTNVQVDGVDEADIVKTDGTYLYIVRNGKVVIVQADPASAMKEMATINVSTDNYYAQDLYVDGNILTVIGSASSPGPIYSPMTDRKMAPGFMPIYRAARTEVHIYDVTDKTKPKITRTVSLEGNKVSTRKIGDKLYLVLNQGMYWGGPVPLLKATEADIVPKFSDSAVKVTDKPVVSCNRISILPHEPSPQYLITAVVPTNDLQKEVQRDVILGNADNVYSSLNNLYVAGTQWNYNWDSANPTSNETTNIFRFGISDTGLKMQAQGSVNGHILNQFSMDENNNTFRIATTTEQISGEHSVSQNNVYILNTDMQTVGKLENLAPGETIYSVRFMGNRAYLVTFKTVDPLFVIDTTDPRNPKVLGKLKIPGYSNYLHPYDETHLIGFGKDVDETIDADKVHSNNAVYYTAVLGMKIGLFDVSDVNNPKEIAKEVIGDRGTDSPLLYDHHALLFDKDTGLLSFPVRVMTYRPEDVNKKPEEKYAVTTFQGAYVYNLSLKNGFDLQGKITHYTNDDIVKSGENLYGKDVERIIRIKDSLLTIGQDGVQSHAKGNISFQNKIDLPVEQGGGIRMY